MAHRLRSELAFCLIGSSAVFLNLSRNRYFQLGNELTAAFRDFMACELVSSEDLQALERAGIIEKAESFVPWKSDLPLAPRLSSAAIRQGQCSVLDVGLALLAQYRAAKRLKATSLVAELDKLALAVRDLPVWAPDVSSYGGAIIRAFERSKLLKSPADLCLPRSIAIVRSLAKIRVRARLVIGVKLAPFAAHAWAQAGDDILNDGFEEVVKYTPILAL